MTPVSIEEVRKNFDAQHFRPAPAPVPAPPAPAPVHQEVPEEKPVKTKNIPALSPRVIEELVATVLAPGAATLARHHLLRLLVAGGLKDRIVRVEGGMKGLTAALGMTENRFNRGAVAEAVEAFQAARFITSVSTCGRVLLLTLDARLTKAFACSQGREARRLVPLLHRLPKFSGARRTWAAQATLALLLLAEFRSQVGEYYVRGAVTISTQRFQEMAQMAGVSWSTIHEVVTAWFEDKFTGVIEIEGVEGWVLLADFSAELAFLGESCKHIQKHFNKRKKAS